MKKLNAVIMVMLLVVSSMGMMFIATDDVSAEYSGYEYYWDDEGGSDNLASTASNWFQMFEGTKTDNVVPTVDSHVYINESASAVTWDLTTFIDNLTISTGYSGIFTWGIKSSIGDLYVTAGTVSGNTYYVDVSGNVYFNPASSTTNHNKFNITGNDKTVYFKNARSLELRVYGNITYTGTGYWINLFTGNDTTIIIPNGGRLGFVETTLNVYPLTLQGNIISTGNGYFVQFYNVNSKTTWFSFYNPQCQYRVDNSGTVSVFQLSLTGDIVAQSITIADSTTGSTATFYTNGYKLSSQVGGHSWGIRTTIYLNDSVVISSGNFAVSASTVNYGTSTIILNGQSTTFTITTSNGATLYNLTVNGSSSYSMASSFTVTSWCYLLGTISLNGYTLNAPMYVITPTYSIVINEGTYYTAYFPSNVTVGLELVTNASWLNTYQFDNLTRGLIGTPGADDSGTYLVNITLSNAIGTIYYEYVLTVENSIYCYFDSEPMISLDAGSMYLYHPDIVCNGTYTFGINNNGALVVSNGTGNVTGSPIAGIYNIELYVIDSSGNIAYQNWTLTVSPVTSIWTNDEIVSMFGMVLFYTILTILSLIGLKSGYALLQLFALLIMVMALPAIWVDSALGVMFELLFVLSNIALLVVGFLGRD